jgi:hypothetical protein
MKKKNIDDEIMNELYRRSFAASTPYGNWDELLENAEINKEGKKIIPFMDYECPHEKLEEIFNSVMDEYKVPKNRINAFSFSFWLGCSPRSSKRVIG